MLQQLLDPWTFITPRRVGGAVVTAAVCCSLQGLKVIPDECRVTAATVISSLSQEGTFTAFNVFQRKLLILFGFFAFALDICNNVTTTVWT